VKGDEPAKGNRDNSGAVFGDFKEHGHGEVEVRTRRVAPAAIVVGKSVVRRAKVCCGDEDGRASRVTPLSVVCALYLKAGAAAEAIVEKGSAQCRRVHTVALAVEVPIPTRSP